MSNKEAETELALRATSELWECKAKLTADPPQDCDWPGCGCDPHADKVIAALQESGVLKDTSAPDEAVKLLREARPYLRASEIAQGAHPDGLLARIDAFLKERA